MRDLGNSVRVRDRAIGGVAQDRRYQRPCIERLTFHESECANVVDLEAGASQYDNLLEANKTSASCKKTDH